MTKLPHPDWNVKGVDGPAYKVGPKCASATCNNWADHGHHIWRRSFLTGDYKWVELWDGVIMQNLCALCFDCHRKVTENEAWITCSDDGEFHYVEEDDPSYKVVLVPQPKTLESFKRAVQLTIDGGEVDHEDVVHDHDEPPCPTCGHKERAKRAKLPPGPKRNRVSWTVSVPKDERENGADVLDELTLLCAERLNRADHSSYKYFTLAEVMASFLMSTASVTSLTKGIDEEDGA